MLLAQRDLHGFEHVHAQPRGNLRAPDRFHRPAARRVREIVANADGPAEGVRVGVKKGGCAGMEYTIDLVRDASRIQFGN